MGLIPAGSTMLCPYASHIYSPEYWLKPGKRWLHPDMTKKLLTGALKHNTKQKKYVLTQSVKINLTNLPESP